MNYGVRRYNGINTDKFLSHDELASAVVVGDYDCFIAYQGVLQHLVDIVSHQPKHNVTLQSVIRAVTRSIDNADILVDCSCPDFNYRFAYWATQYGYKYGDPENRPSNITNPDNDIGSMCKHLTSILANKKWLVKLSSIVNDFVKANIDDIRNMFDLSEDDFFINEPGRPSTKTNRNIRMIPKNIPEPNVPDKLSDFKDKKDDEEDTDI